MSTGYHPFNSTVPEIDETTEQWLTVFHTDPNQLGSFYSEKALLFYEKEAYIQGAAPIMRFYGDLAGQYTISDYNVAYRIRLTENPDMVYETGRFYTGTGEAYLFLTIWSRQKDRWLREIDILAGKSNGVPEDPAIDIARASWIRYSNSHNALSLAEYLYHKDFVYYNRGILYENYPALADVYSYMDQEDFQVNLTKDFLLMAQPDLAFEIGTWTSNGTGSYIILWEKRDNQWGIRLDVNW